MPLLARKQSIIAGSICAILLAIWQYWPKPSLLAVSDQVLRSAFSGNSDKILNYTSQFELDEMLLSRKMWKEILDKIILPCFKEWDIVDKGKMILVNRGTTGMKYFRVRHISGKEIAYLGIPAHATGDIPAISCDNLVGLETQLVGRLEGEFDGNNQLMMQAGNKKLIPLIYNAGVKYLVSIKPGEKTDIKKYLEFLNETK